VAVYGPGATLFTLGANSTVQQFDLNSPAIMVANVQHPANLLPPSPPVSIEEQAERSVTTTIVTDSDTSGPIEIGISESDEDLMSPNRPHMRSVDRNEASSPVSSRSGTSYTFSESSTGSRTPGLATRSVKSRAVTENTYISAGSSLRSSHHPYRDRDLYSQSSRSTTSYSSRSRHRPSRLRNEVLNSPEENKVQDLFKYTRARLTDIPYKPPAGGHSGQLTNDDLRRQMLTTVFGWHKEIEDLVRDEISRNPAGSPSRILLAKWLGDINPDVMAAASAENMTSSDWMLLALSGIGQSSQSKLGRTYIQRLLESGDIHTAATIMIGLGDYNDAIEIYVSHKRYMEALILSCLFFPSVWERQCAIVKKWGEWAVQHGQQQLAIRW
jgi:hypothetical protein